MSRSMLTWKAFRTAERLAYLLALLAFVSWFVPEQSLQNCRHAQKWDCSITEDNLINHIWGWTLLFSWLGAVFSASVVIANNLLGAKKREFLFWAIGLLAVSSLAVLNALIAIPRWVRKTYPGNTINWRHDQAMSAIWMDVWMVLAVLFIMAVAAVTTCGFLIYRQKANHRLRLAVILRMIILIVLIATWGYMVSSNP